MSLINFSSPVIGIAGFVFELKAFSPSFFLLHPDIHRQELAQKTKKSRCSLRSIGTTRKRVEIKAVNPFRMLLSFDLPYAAKAFGAALQSEGLS